MSRLSKMLSLAEEVPVKKVEFPLIAGAVAVQCRGSLGGKGNCALQQTSHALPPS